MLCTSTFNGDQNLPETETKTQGVLQPFMIVCKYADMQLPTYFCFDPNNDIVHACSVQKLSLNWLSMFHNIKGKYAAPHWCITNKEIRSQQKINHQCWGFQTGSITPTAICPIDVELYDIIQFFRCYPHSMTESNGFVRFMGNTFELIDGKLGDFNFPIVWDMQLMKANLLQHKGLFDPPLEDDCFCAHLQQTVLSIPQKAVAMVGAFDKSGERDGKQFYPTGYSYPFINICKLDDTAELLWEWHGQKPEFSSSNLVVSFAFSPDPESGLFVFSTRAALKDGDGLYLANLEKMACGSNPNLFQVSCCGFFTYCPPSNPETEWYAYQLVFNCNGDLLFAITASGGCEKKNDGTWDADYCVLSVYDTESFNIVCRLVGRSPFSTYTQTVFLSWQLAENGQDLEGIHVSKTMKLQAVHAKLCTTTGMMSIRILGSLPTMGGMVKVSKFAIDRSFLNDVCLNVVFRFGNMPLIAISFPDIIAGPWEHVLGVFLTDENKAQYQPSITHLTWA